MGRRRSDETKKRITQIKLDEAANAVIWVLEEHDKRWEGKTLKKEYLLQRIPDAIHKMRKNHGVNCIPTVENRQVDIASVSFVKSNWTAVCLRCAEFGYFVIWNPHSESPGLRLGTIEEYEYQQSQLLSVTSGFAGYHNRRSDIIETHGHTSTDLHVEVKRHFHEE